MNMRCAVVFFVLLFLDLLNGGGSARSTTGTTYYAGFGGSSFTAVGAANVSTNVLATKTDGKVTITFLCQ